MTTEDPVASVAVGSLGAVAALTLALGLLLRLPALVAPAAGIVGAAYAIALVADGEGVDLQAPLVGAALLIVCELAYWSHELRTTAPDEPGARATRVAWLALLGAVSILPGVALLAAADLVRIEGIAIEAVGAVAAGGLLVGLVLVTRADS